MGNRRAYLGSMQVVRREFGRDMEVTWKGCMKGMEEWQDGSQGRQNDGRENEGLWMSNEGKGRKCNKHKIR